MTIELEELVADIGLSIKRIDSRRPQAANVRTGVAYQPGIGPHPETQAVALIVTELRAIAPERYDNHLHTDIPYRGISRQKCDLCTGAQGDFDWAIEIKMLRLMGDNGKPNDNMLMYILSPYVADRSALTDCSKLLAAGPGQRKAVVIYGFDYPGLPMDPAIEAFEVLAGTKVQLGLRASAEYGDLVHPVHKAGRVFGWEVRQLAG